MSGKALDWPRRLAACIVSRGAGAFALRCAESLRREWERAEQDPEALELVVCDVAGDTGESTWWRSLEGLGARVVSAADEPDERARVARALAGTRGDPGDLVALLAADVYFLPDALRSSFDLVAERPELGAWIPRAFLDELLEIALPPPGARPRRERMAARAARSAPAFAAMIHARRLASARAWWEAEEPVEIALPVGPCVFARRAVVDAVLDSDAAGVRPALVRALRRSGLRAVRSARARIVHHGSRWPGFGAQGGSADSDGLGAKLCRAAGVATRSMRRAVEAGDLGALTEPPTIALPRLAHFLLELAPDLPASPAAGILGAGASYRMPFRSWSWLRPGRYELRALDRKSGAPLGAWRFEKTTPARSWPLDPSSVSHLEPRPTPTIAPRAERRGREAE